MENEIRQMENRLREAMLASNVAELVALIDDRLLFIGPASAVHNGSWPSIGLRPCLSSSICFFTSDSFPNCCPPPTSRYLW